MVSKSPAFENIEVEGINQKVESRKKIDSLLLGFQLFQIVSQITEKYI